MMRTTIDIDSPVLRELKQLQKRDGKTLGRLVSDLLADALGRQRTKPVRRLAFRWTRRSMRARVDLTDKDALYAALDEAGHTRPTRGGPS